MHGACGWRRRRTPERAVKKGRVDFQQHYFGWIDVGPPARADDVGEIGALGVGDEHHARVGPRVFVDVSFGGAANR